jgi:hypothetical protein
MMQYVADLWSVLDRASGRRPGCQFGSALGVASSGGCHSGTVAAVRRSSRLAAVVVGCGLVWGSAAPLAAQASAPNAAPARAALTVATLDGRLLAADALVAADDGYLLRGPSGEIRLPRDGLLALHGAPIQEAGLPCAWLAGGEVVRGALVGGDDAGDELELLSPTLDKVAIAVDRLAALTRTAQSEPADLVLPEGVAEAVFRRAKFGFDLVVGSVHQFGARGVRFAAQGQAEPKWLALDELVGLRIADPLPREGEAEATLWTRTGDRLGVALRGSDAAGLRCELEGGRAAVVRWTDVAALVVRGGAMHLSDLEPAQVAEGGYDGETLYPWRRDRAVLGGPLVAGGRSFGKGLGVHGKCRLVYRVPDGVDRFWTRVALDDTAAALPVRPSVDVRVLVDSEVAWARQDLVAGAEPADTGVLRVAPGQRLTLEVEFGKGRELGDRVAWLLPVFLPPRTKGS